MLIFNFCIFENKNVLSVCWYRTSLVLTAAASSFRKRCGPMMPLACCNFAYLHAHWSRNAIKLYIFSAWNLTTSVGDTFAWKSWPASYFLFPIQQFFIEIFHWKMFYFSVNLPLIKVLSREIGSNHVWERLMI